MTVRLRNRIPARVLPKATPNWHRLAVAFCWQSALPATQALIDSIAGQTVNIANIPLRGMYPLPPLAEQQRIAARVEQLFSQTRQLADLFAHAQQSLTNTG